MTPDVLPGRIAEKISMSRSAPGCWEWMAYTDAKGYGIVWWLGSSRKAHRVVYELLVGPIPEGLQLDHLCRNSPCVRPDHLEPVTNRENVLRGQSPNAQAYRLNVCVSGRHTLDGPNVRFRPGIGRECLACRRIREGRNK